MSAIHVSTSKDKAPDGLEFQYLHSHIQTPTGVLEPDDARTLTKLTVPVSIDWQLGIVIEGKSPIWLYSYLLHQCHPAPWIACYDPRLGCVVVSSQTSTMPVGTVLPMHPSS